MNNKNMEKPNRKQKALHELREFLVLFLYLAFFFCGIATYRMLLLSEFHVESLIYAFALINALVVAKVIMIGEYAKVGKRHESKPLILSAAWKAVLFTLLVLAFHIAEELIKRLLHGESISGAYRTTSIDVLLAQSLIVFCTFVPLFGFREFRRVLGEEKFHAMLWGSGEAGKSEPPSQR